MSEDWQQKRDMIKSKWSKIRKSSGDKGAAPGSQVIFTDNIADFLAGANKTAPLQHQQQQQGTRPPTTPKLNISIAQRWPDASQIQQLNTSPAREDPPRRPRRAKKVGLVVRFTSAPPDIIGCGGDETEIPPIHISESRRRPMASRSQSHGPAGRPEQGHLSIRPALPDRPGSAHGRPDAYSQLAAAGIFGARSPVRAEHGQAPRGTEPPRVPPRNGQYEEHRPEHALRPQDHSVPRIELDRPIQHNAISPHQHSLQRVASRERLQSTQSRMRAEEGRAFSQAYRLSQTFPDGQAVSRSASQNSQHSAISQRSQDQPRSPGYQPAAQPSRLKDASGHNDYLAPVTGHYPHPSSPKGSNLHPDSYFAGASTRERSSSTATDRSIRAHDSPQQVSVRTTPHFNSALGPPSPGPERSATVVVRNIHSVQKAAQRKPIAPSSPALSHTPSTASTVRSEASIPYKAFSRGPAAVDMADDTASEEPHVLSQHASSPLDDFASRVSQMKSVFRLTAQKERSQSDIAASDWLRCAHWWFLSGKVEMQRDPRPHQQDLLTQTHVDIAKAWWVLNEMLDHDAQGASDGPADAQSMPLRQEIEMFATWMQSHHCMPPHASLIQGQDTTIWIRQPQLPPEMAKALGCSPWDSVPEAVPLNDTKHYFYLDTLFVNVNVVSQHSSFANVPCLMSIIRHRLNYRVSMLIASYDRGINVLIAPETSEKHAAPTWYDISWRSKSCSMAIRLALGVVLDVSLIPRDYGVISTAIERTRAIDRSFHPAGGESVVFSAQLHEARFTSSDAKADFPAESIRRCFIGVFEHVETEIHEHHKRKAHRGFRVMLITPSTSKSLGVVSKIFDSKCPFLYTLGNTDKASLVFQSAGAGPAWKIDLTFESKMPRAELLRLMTGQLKTSDEHTQLSLPVRSVSVGSCMPSPDSTALDVLQQLHWSSIQIISSRSHTSTVLNPSLRLLLPHTTGTIVDRINLVPGSLFFRLPCNAEPRISFFRPQQTDVLQSVSSETHSSTLPDLLLATNIMSTTSTIRHYTFPTITDQHSFQTALTGFYVLFDSCPEKFSMTRHRSLTSISKRIDATRLRLQVLTRTSDPSTSPQSGSTNSDTQIALWFDDFPLAESLILPLKSSDAYERTKGPSGPASAVRLVEAKFTLPTVAAPRANKTNSATGAGGPLSPSPSFHSSLGSPTSPPESPELGGNSRWTEGVRKISFGKKFGKMGGREQESIPGPTAEDHPMDHHQVGREAQARAQAEAELEEEHGDGDVPPSWVRRAFVNVEGLDWAEESDDVVIAFASDEEAERFCAVLPGVVAHAGSSAASRLFKRR